jgi:hypothetical protein
VVRIDDSSIYLGDGDVLENEIFFDINPDIFRSLQNARRITVQLEHDALGNQDFRFLFTETPKAWDQWVAACNTPWG